MIGRVLLVIGACGLVYACARDQAKRDVQHEAALERRITVLEQHVRALEARQASGVSPKNQAAPTDPAPISP